MYNDYFDLRKTPFGISPDPDFLFLSQQHREALAHIHYACLQSSSFVVLTGPVGVGKTLIIRTFAQQLPANVQLAVCFNPLLKPQALLSTILLDFGLTPVADDYQKLYQQLNDYLLACHHQQQRCLLILDEAHLLGDDLLHHLRLLTNLETHQHKLLQILLVGQSELNQRLAQPCFEALNQRVTARYHLRPLSTQDSKRYIYHRLHQAGGHSFLLTKAALRRLIRHGGGIPRLINRLADRALLAGYGAQQRRITGAMVNSAWREMQPPHHLSWRYEVWIAGLLLIITGLGVYTTLTVSPVPSQLTAPIAQTKHSLGLAQLLALWLPSQKIPPSVSCERLPTPLLTCQAGQGQWQRLVAERYPVLLTLTQPHAAVLLVKVAQDQAQLVTDQGQETWPISRLQKQWQGQQWQRLIASEPPTIPITAESSPQAIQWLSAQLNSGQFKATQSAWSLTLNEQLRSFQRQHGLTADGIAGVRTLQALEKRFQQQARW